MSGLIGIKCGTSRLYNEKGGVDQVTVIKIFPNFVAEKKTTEKHGYAALQLASLPAQKQLQKVKAGLYSKLKIAEQKALKEFKFDASDYDAHQPGSELDVSLMSGVKEVSVTGTSIGKGFAGCVKRWNFRMQRATHGNSLSHRAPGSIGQCQDPGRVIKGKKMAGRLGGKQRTVKGLEIMRIDEKDGLLIIKGSVPGYDGSVVYVRKQKSSAE
jgi:large subunit ribosomal protein L3